MPSDLLCYFTGRDPGCCQRYSQWIACFWILGNSANEMCTFIYSQRVAMVIITLHVDLCESSVTTRGGDLFITTRVPPFIPDIF